MPWSGLSGIDFSRRPEPPEPEIQEEKAPAPAPAKARERGTRPERAPQRPARHMDPYFRPEVPVPEEDPSYEAEKER